MCEKGFFASICSFFKGLFSSSPASNDSKPAASAKKSNDLTGVERYIRNQTENGAQLTGVEQYIRNQVTGSKAVSGVEQYLRNQSQAKPSTGVERYIQRKG